jgi:hypothetical protein
MREVIAVCRSGGKARDRAATVLDRYFWRIGDRTWRGQASNACLDRVSSELKKRATRNMAVAIHEIRSSHASRMPLIRIGSKSAFSQDGLVPVATHPAEVSKSRFHADMHGVAVVRIAALFHDLGKATVLFQAKLKKASSGKKTKPQADVVRHELFSAVVWDILFGRDDDRQLIEKLLALSPSEIDEACKEAQRRLRKIHSRGAGPLDLDFTKTGGPLAFAIGMLVLTHHRLPDGGSNHTVLTSGNHVRHQEPLDVNLLAIESGVPFWHEDWWRDRIAKNAGYLRENAPVCGLDMLFRASLMFADHLGSAKKQPSQASTGHLANTIDNQPADSLLLHVQRVYRHSRSAFDLLHRHRGAYPSLDAGQIPLQVLHPSSAHSRFRWQKDASDAAATLCSAREGGFFACIVSGTGTGKTQGAPTVLAAAAMSDAVESRRGFRMTLALGLRSLASQSAREYVSSIGFAKEHVSFMVGKPPIEFIDDEEAEANGSESQSILPEWMQIRMAEGDIPREGDENEGAWLRGLSMNTDHMLPAFIAQVLEHDRDSSRSRRLLTSPVLVATVDHLMSVAAPTKSQYLMPLLRVATSDLILDEVDQYSPEDISALCRLVYQAGVSGRRVVLMSATMPLDVGSAFHRSYTAGWKEFARACGASDHVNVLCVGDAPGSCASNIGGETFEQVFERSSAAIVSALENAAVQRRAEILPPVVGWTELVDQVDASCSRMHDLNAVEIGGFRVSVGLVRMTRVIHTAAMASQLPSGSVRGRFRVLVCLHSYFPRLHREWIERRLKEALTRKMPRPDKGVADLCEREGVFRRAGAAKDIEIVVVTSPVIETGNDIDFDYGIFDPVSVRSVIQAAGRVRRHRPPNGKLNVLMLGRSAVAMQDGALRMPGVETWPHDETKVARVGLESHPDRLTKDLWAGVSVDAIDARLVMSGSGFPLRKAEEALRKGYVWGDADAASPLGKYLSGAIARMNLQFTRSRRFRRASSRNLRYSMEGDDILTAEWRLDMAPGTRNSNPVEAVTRGLVIRSTNQETLFPNLINDAAMDLERSPSRGLALTAMDAEIPDYSFGSGDIALEMSYSPFTGFTRGNEDPLVYAFS